MVSIEFIYYFLPIFMGLYLILTPRFRGKLISLGGAALIAWVSPWGLIPFAAAIFTAYLGGIFIFNFRQKKNVQRFFLFLSILIDLSAYLLFALSNIHGNAHSLVDISPLNAFTAFGAGVYTLNSMGYCIDVFNGRTQSEQHFSTVVRYIAFFPAFILGPLVPLDVLREDLRNPRMSLDKSAEGIFRLLLGIFKKVIFANAMYEMWRDVKNVNVASLPVMAAWLGIVAFCMFVYFELSAYSDIASGLGLMMGFKLPRNIRTPFRSRSFHEFFYRFNTSLYNWTRRSIYQTTIDKFSTPIAKIAATFLCFSAAALWYTKSLNSLIFALLLLLCYITEQAFGDYLKKLPSHLSRAIFLVVLLIILPFLAYNDPIMSLSYIGAMFGSNTVAADMISDYLVNSYAVYFVLAILIVAGAFDFLSSKLEAAGEHFRTVLRPIFTISLLLICTIFMASVDKELLNCLI